MTQTYLTLNNGLKMPQFGLGVYLVPDGKETIEACLNAFKLGVRHIDTAHAYQNERGVGEALKQSGLKREEVWITTKLWPTEYGEGKTLPAIDKMLERLQTDYIDLLLLHQQVGDYIGAWKDMEKAVKLGKVKSIGISNFKENLEDLLASATIKPAAIQVECHPYFPQNELKKRMAEFGTILESWYPIGHGDPKLINEPVFTKLAQKYGKTNVQIILRWHIQEGNSVFPKTTNPDHMRENFDIFDFELSAEDMAEIAKLDNGKRYYTADLAQQQQFTQWKPED
ncbi:MAG: aldo/keto reductase [Alphaproteobacteria bacterium]|nr:aldo/keto reductase [Alphaproteobacteria bacterium]